MFTKIINTLARPDGAFSRYDLYFEFIYRFVQRENAKPSRNFGDDKTGDQAVGYSDPRTIFMQRLAWWLLTEKKENRFKAQEVPHEFIPQALRNSKGSEAALREIIVGSAVEHLGDRSDGVIGVKGPKIYYFPHKSYVEFLVAEFFCREKFSIEMYATFYRYMNSEILSFIAEGPAEAVANLRTGLDNAKGTISSDVLTIAARDPGIAKEETALAVGNTTAGRLYVYYRYLLNSRKEPEKIEAFLFNAMSKANNVGRISAAYAMLSDYLGRTRSSALFERLLALVLTKVGVFKLKEMLSDGASIYSVDGPAAHMIFLSACGSLEHGVLQIDIQDMKLFARDACQKSLYISGFDTAPSKENKTYNIRLNEIRGVPQETRTALNALPQKVRLRFRSQVHGGQGDFLAGRSYP